MKLRQELDDLYESAKDKLEKKNTTIESIIFEQLKYMPNQFLTVKGIQQVFEKLSIIVSKNEAEHVLHDLRKHFNNRFELCFKDFIDFTTRKRISSAFVDKGFVDPMIAQCCQQVNKCANTYDITFEQIFNTFDMEHTGILSKENFLKCIQGMELGIAIEDIVEFFNFIDDKSEN